MEPFRYEQEGEKGMTQRTKGPKENDVVTTPGENKDLKTNNLNQPRRVAVGSIT